MTAASIRAALLFDADNFNDPDQMRAVHAQFAQRVGKGFICHAHGAVSVWQRAGFKDALADIGGRFVPGLPLDKNTTDAGLIIDALMLHFQHGIRRFGIASGDADFAPLAVQLRELGCEVSAYARHAIAFNRMVNYYDHVVRFDTPPNRLPMSVPAPISVPVPAPVLSPVMPPAPVKPPVVVKEPLASVAHASASAAAKPKPSVQSVGALPDEVASVLKLLPELQDKAQHLSVIVPRLKKTGMIGKKAGEGARFLRQWPQCFTLTPVRQPNQVSLTPMALQTLQASNGVAKQQSESKVQKAASKTAQKQAFTVADTPPVHVLGEPLAKRTALKPLASHLHALRHVLHEVRYLKITPLQVLQTAPELVSGERFALGSVGSRLRAQGLIDPTHSALRVLRHMTRSFEIEMNNPQWVRYRG